MTKYSVLALIFMLFSTCHSRILEVPLDFETIQEAINHCQRGDTVLVQRGVYRENLTISTNPLVLASNYINDNELETIQETVIMPGNELFRPISVLFEQRIAEQIIIGGFTIRGGAIYPQGIQSGGGIYAENCDIKISNCIITNNTAYRGGGIGVRNCNSYIQNCRIVANHYASTGGGIHISDEQFEGYHILRGNSFMENIPLDHLPFASSAGGCLIGGSGGSGGVIEENIFQSNIGTSYCAGLRIAYNPGEGVETWRVSNNAFIENNSKGHTALELSHIDSVIIENNEFRANQAFPLEEPDLYSWGSAIYVGEEVSYCSINGNLFLENVARGGSPAIMFQSSGQMNNNMFVGNLGYDYGAVSTWINLNDDPINVSGRGNIFSLNGRLTPDVLYFYGSVCSFQNTSIILSENDFLDNEYYAVGQSDDRPGYLNVDNNYWGDSSGPFHADINPNGIGDSIRTNVSFQSYSEIPFTAPSPFNLTSPEDEEILTNGEVVFSWSSSHDPTTMNGLEYTLELSRTDDFSDIQSFQSGIDTQLVVNVDDWESIRYWRVYVEDSFQLRTYSSQIHSFFLTSFSGSLRNKKTPDSPHILSTYPNPFNNIQNIEIVLPQSANASLVVFNLLGEELFAISSGFLGEGTQTFSWQTNDQSAGIYFLFLLINGTKVDSRKLVVLK